MIKANTKKIIFIILILCSVMLVIIPEFTMAKTTSIINPDNYKPESTSEASGGDNYLKDMANAIVGSIRVVGSIISVITLIIIGIKYMIASAEERAEYKKTMKPYIIGAVLLFGITNILVIISNIVQEVIK